MSTTTITYNLEITNNKLVTPIYYTNTITPAGKVERELYDIDSGDGYYDISIAKVGTVQTVFANSDDANLSFYTSAGVITNIRIGGQFMWEVPSALGSGLINCRVSTSSSIPVNITLTIIGV